MGAPEDGPIYGADPRTMGAVEDRLRDTFAVDAGAALRCADTAAEVLKVCLIAIRRPDPVKIPVDEHGETRYSTGTKDLQLAAQMFIGARAFRVIRAARSVLASGHEREVGALDRVLVELLIHRQSIMADDSGNEALNWLRRKSGHGITKKARSMGMAQLYANLCTDAHGDPGPILRLQDEHGGEIELSPHRTNATRASLLLHAGFAHDQGRLISSLSGATLLPDADKLRDAIRAGWDELRGDDEAHSGT